MEVFNIVTSLAKDNSEDSINPDLGSLLLTSARFSISLFLEWLDHQPLFKVLNLSL